ncbi:hypothetical protein Leryth_018820 [Lithospermum erythrorhizon]|nr:hypothetical protein Leryth_018820 [Lithospermum erythrorhizon]
MMLRTPHSPFSLSKSSPLFLLLTKTPSFFQHSNQLYISNTTCFQGIYEKDSVLSGFVKKRSNFCTITAVIKDPFSSFSSLSDQMSNKARKKARKELPEFVLKHKLDLCSKNGDFDEGIRLYEEAKVNGTSINIYHYNALLYLCSCSEGVDNWGLDKGFEIFKQMGIDKVVPNEATFTSAARLAAKKEDPEMAFELVKRMKGCGIEPKLRSYGPALFGFCKKGLSDKAYEVDRHMVESGVEAEEGEISALLKVSADMKRADKVYEMMHRLRAAVRQVAEDSARVLEEWFMSESAGDVGVEKWDVGKVKEGVVKGGGGWHGQGWLGKGKWRVVRTQMDENGVCGSCREKLVCIDIDPKETENFANSLAKLASEREVRSNFVSFKKERKICSVPVVMSTANICFATISGIFYIERLQTNVEGSIIQEWLQKHGPFDAIVDGANIGLANQHHFNFSQLKSIVNQLRQISPSKRLPLVILHKSRVTGGPAQHPNNKKLLDSWKNAGALYSTPQGSNDDWGIASKDPCKYWLYAAVSCKCLLVTNDEMRDHLFQLLGTNFFPRWKEKHQVRLAISKQSKGPILSMPPPYSIVIQESEQGSWHIPTVTGDDLETPRQWLCATRSRKLQSLFDQITNIECTH